MKYWIGGLLARVVVVLFASVLTLALASRDAEADDEGSEAAEPTQSESPTAAEAAAFSAAQPLDYLPADPNFVFMFSLQRIRDAESSVLLDVATAVIASIPAGAFHFDPIADAELIVAGLNGANDEPSRGVIVATGRFDVAAIEAQILGIPNSSVVQHGLYRHATWMDDSEPQHLLIGGSMLVSADSSNIARVLATALIVDQSGSRGLVAENFRRVPDDVQLAFAVSGARMGVEGVTLVRGGANLDTAFQGELVIGFVSAATAAGSVEDIQTLWRAFVATPEALEFGGPELAAALSAVQNGNELSITLQVPESIVARWTAAALLRLVAEE